MNPENSPTIYALIFMLVGATGEIIGGFLKLLLPIIVDDGEKNKVNNLVGPDGHTPLRHYLPSNTSARNKIFQRVKHILRQKTISPKKRLLNRALAIMIILILGVVGFEIGKNIRNGIFEVPSFQLAIGTATPINTPNPEETATPFPTPIGRGTLQAEINFAQVGEGACNNYDNERLGYDNQQYYINPYPSSGYIAICHGEGSLESEGVLYVSAYPEENPSYYGFGVLFGWAGSERSTTDACIIGVRRVNYSSVEAVFIEASNGQWTEEVVPAHNVELGNESSTLHVALNEQGLAQAYLNNRFIGEHRFDTCGSGPIGLIAWNLQDGKVYFDDFKLFELP